MSGRPVVLRTGERDYRTTVGEAGVTIDDAPVMPVSFEGPAVLRVGADGRRAWAVASGSTRWVFLDGRVYEFEVQDSRPRRAAAGAHAPLASPMPATVVRVEAMPGAAVRKGDTLLILEAMKMELPIRAPADGVVRAVHCRVGELVKPGVALVDLDPAGADIP